MAEYLPDPRAVLSAEDFERWQAAGARVGQARAALPRLQAQLAAVEAAGDAVADVYASMVTGGLLPEGWVADVQIPGGLWVRPAGPADQVAAERATLTDPPQPPAAALIVVGLAGAEVPLRVWQAVRRALEQMPEEDRAVLRVRSVDASASAHHLADLVTVDEPGGAVAVQGLAQPESHERARSPYREFREMAVSPQRAVSWPADTPFGSAVEPGAGADDAGRGSPTPAQLVYLVAGLVAERMPGGAGWGSLAGCAGVVREFLRSVYGALGAVDDAVVGLGGVRGVQQSVVAGPGWGRMGTSEESWNELQQAVDQAGEGASAVVLVSFARDEVGHALALYHTREGGLQWVDPAGPDLVGERPPQVLGRAVAAWAVVIGADGRVTEVPGGWSAPESSGGAGVWADPPLRHDFGSMGAQIERPDAPALPAAAEPELARHATGSLPGAAAAPATAATPTTGAAPVHLTPRRLGRLLWAEQAAYAAYAAALGPGGHAAEHAVVLAARDVWQQAQASATAALGTLEDDLRRWHPVNVPDPGRRWAAAEALGAIVDLWRDGSYQPLGEVGGRYVRASSWVAGRTWYQAAVLAQALWVTGLIDAQALSYGSRAWVPAGLAAGGLAGAGGGEGGLLCRAGGWRGGSGSGSGRAGGQGRDWRRPRQTERRAFPPVGLREGNGEAHRPVARAGVPGQGRGPLRAAGLYLARGPRTGNACGGRAGAADAGGAR